MVWLVALAGALGGLYFWLIGNWFARIVVAVCFVIFGIFTSKMFEGTPLQAFIFFGFPLVSWPLASIPTWIKRRREKNQSEPFVIPYPN